MKEQNSDPEIQKLCQHALGETEMPKCYFFDEEVEAINSTYFTGVECT